jgi:hypothetical protein
VTLLKSQTDFTSPFSSFKEKIQPHTIEVLETEKVGGCLDLIFGFSGVNDTA